VGGGPVLKITIETTPWIALVVLAFLVGHFV